MSRTHRYISSLLLAAALASPIAVLANPPQKATVQLRVYDRGHKDYHNWGDRENRAWRTYRTENHWAKRDYQKANRRQQEEYWKWRHTHPDRY